MAESNSDASGAAPSESISVSTHQYASTSSFLWSPLASLFSSRATEHVNVTVNSSPSPSLPIGAASANQGATSPQDASSSAFRWLSSLASVFAQREVEGSILVQLESRANFGAIGTASSAQTKEFELTEHVKDLNNVLRDRILATLTGISESEISGRGGKDSDEMAVEIDEGFVYMSSNGGGMQTEEGDYLMYGHVAFPLSLHGHLLSIGVRPHDIQQALDLHDSNPDKAVDWILSTKLTSTKSTPMILFTINL